MVSVGGGLGAGVGMIFLGFFVEGGGVAKTEDRWLGIARFLVERRRVPGGLPFFGDLRGVDSSFLVLLELITPVIQ